MLFMGLLEVFLRSQCDLEDPCNRPKVSVFRESFDKCRSFIHLCVNRLGRCPITNMISSLLAAAQEVQLSPQDYPKFHIGKFYSSKQVCIHLTNII